MSSLLRRLLNWHGRPCGAVVLILFAAPVFAGEFVPALNRENWSEQAVANKGAEFDEIRSSSQNAFYTTGAAIISGFSGNVMLETFSRSEDVYLGDLETAGFSDYLIDEEEARLFGIATCDLPLGSIDAGVDPASLALPSRLRYFELGIDDAETNGIPALRRVASVGVVGSLRYRSVLESEGLRIEEWVTRREILAGIDRVETLLPGADLPTSTGGFDALVRIVETHLELSETYLDDALEDELTIRDLKTTSVEWLVDGVGRVRFLILSGAWLDDILDGNVFEDGSGVVGTRSLLELVGEDSVSLEELLEAGDVSRAKSLVLAGVGQSIALWEELPVPTGETSNAFEQAVALAGLSGVDSLADAKPFGDGVSNLLKFASGMSLDAFDDTVVGEDAGALGRPRLSVTSGESGVEFVVDFVRRLDGEIGYRVELSEDGSHWTEGAGATLEVMWTQGGFEGVRWRLGERSGSDDALLVRLAVFLK